MDFRDATAPEITETLGNAMDWAKAVLPSETRIILVVIEPDGVYHSTTDVPAESYLDILREIVANEESGETIIS